ncbi:MAG: phospholipid carrier-dependent glycosyltransferase, partial [Planctomycetes bacterium]|nr:phospholipid carrier-dependent glycosyltransferase [Planctomycetota bacterium]
MILDFGFPICDWRGGQSKIASRKSQIWLFLLLLIVGGALAFRLPGLAERPMHCDEAVQAIKTGILAETGDYRYNPQEYHGPSLYYLSLPSVWLAGGKLATATETTFRIVPVLFGVGLVLLVLLVGDGLGRPAMACAAALTAISPAMVFYSRYYIQEMLLVFFTFAAIATGWRYARTE